MKLLSHTVWKSNFTTNNQLHTQLKVQKKTPKILNTPNRFLAHFQCMCNVITEFPWIMRDWILYTTLLHIITQYTQHTQHTHINEFSNYRKNGYHLPILKDVWDASILCSIFFIINDEINSTVILSIFSDNFISNELHNRLRVNYFWVWNFLGILISLKKIQCILWSYNVQF